MRYLKKSKKKLSSFRATFRVYQRFLLRLLEEPLVPPSPSLLLYTLYSILCTLYFILCTLYSVLCTLYSVPGYQEDLVTPFRRPLLASSLILMRDNLQNL